jgi:hypothetical protein
MFKPLQDAQVAVCGSGPMWKVSADGMRQRLSTGPISQHAGQKRAASTGAATVSPLPIKIPGSLT